MRKLLKTLSLLMIVGTFAFILASCKKLAITVTPTEATVGQEITLEANLKKVEWSSSNPTVVKITGDSKAKAIAAGEATLTAKSGKKTQSVKVVVKTPAPVQLAAPVVALNENTISWGAVANAAGYAIYQGSTLLVNNHSSLSYDLSNANLAVGTHSITVKALGNGSSYADSNASNAVTYVVEQEAAQLAAPTIELQDDMLSWAAVENATSYAIYNGTTLLVEVSGTSYDLSTAGLPKGTNSITIKALGDDAQHLDSNASNAVEYEVTDGNEAEELAAPVISLSESTISWAAVENATGYAIYAGSAVVVRNHSALSYDLSTANLAGGTHSITVKALGNGTTHVDSPASNAVSYTVEGTGAALVAPTIVLEGSTLSWAAVANASGYALYDGSNLVLNVTTTSFDLSTAGLSKGKHSITVKALGDGTAYLDSAASNAVEYEVTGEIGDYEPKWELNQMGWDGNQMKYKILVSPISEYDPFDAGYSATGNKKLIKQNHQRMVEQAYNIDIDYFEWATLAKWGPDRVAYINENYLSKEIFTNNEAYVVQIACSWVPTLVKNGSLASLYQMQEMTGYFAEVPGVEEGDEFYMQNSTYNDLTNVNKYVYGYTLGGAHADQMIYYNVDLVKELGLTDPAELWFKGEWTLSNFESWVQEGQTNMSNTEGGKFVIDMGYPEFSVGLVASTGGKMTSTTPAQILFARPAVTSVIDKIQSFYKLGYYNNHGVADVTTNFLNGETVLHSGSIWFLRNKDRFNPEVITFKIGAVPYPTADGQGGTPILTSDAEEALVTINGEKLTDADGNYIKGVDMSNSTFQVPITDGSCYSVLNIQNGKNGINSQIAFYILHDLMAGEGKDPTADVELTAEEAYKQTLESKLDYPIHAAAILSTEENTYFEMIEIVSMTVGNGSHFGDNALWKLIPGIITKDVTARTELNAVLEIYKAALRAMGYVVN